MSTKEPNNEDLGLVFDSFEIEKEDFEKVDLVSDLFTELSNELPEILPPVVSNNLPTERITEKAELIKEDMSPPKRNFEVEKKDLVDNDLSKTELEEDKKNLENNIFVEPHLNQVKTTSLNKKTKYSVIATIISCLGLIIWITSPNLEENKNSTPLAITVNEDLIKSITNNTKNSSNKNNESKSVITINIERFESYKEFEDYSTNVKVSVNDKKLSEVIYELDRIKTDYFTGEELVSKHFKPRLKSVNVLINKQITETKFSGTARIFYLLGSKEKKLIKEIFAEYEESPVKQIRIFTENADINSNTVNLSEELNLDLNLKYKLTPVKVIVPERKIKLPEIVKEEDPKEKKKKKKNTEKSDSE